MRSYRSLRTTLERSLTYREFEPFFSFFFWKFPRKKRWYTMGILKIYDFFVKKKVVFLQKKDGFSPYFWSLVSKDQKSVEKKAPRLSGIWNISQKNCKNVWIFRRKLTTCWGFAYQTVKNWRAIDGVFEIFVFSEKKKSWISRRKLSVFLCLFHFCLQN